ncbi:hypothetical protein [Streptomyces sp. NPDC002463]|uniref:hypothetical protein n=1 Tax=Streptomyces sp. NPDC002463 TaxID=3364645 RepID=UPI003682EE61
MKKALGCSAAAVPLSPGALVADATKSTAATQTIGQGRVQPCSNGNYASDFQFQIAFHSRRGDHHLDRIEVALVVWVRTSIVCQAPVAASDRYGRRSRLLCVLMPFFRAATGAVAAAHPRIIPR